MLVIHALSSIAIVAAVSSVEKSEPVDAFYDSEKAAATAAINQHNPTSIAEDREYIGAIYQTDAGFSFSVIKGKRRSDQVQMRISVTELDEVVAFWHTHGDSTPSNRYFSNVDTKLAAETQRPFYLGDYTGYLKVFEPDGKTLNPFAAYRLGLPRLSGYSVGELVKDQSRRPIRINTRAVC